MFVTFFWSRIPAPPALHSLPTRRYSDLIWEVPFGWQEPGKNFAISPNEEVDETLADDRQLSDDKEQATSSNGEVAYNKERVLSYNTNIIPEGDINVSKRQNQNRMPINWRDFVAVAPDDFKPKITPVLANSLKKYFPDDPIGQLAKAFADDIEKPLEWLWSAIIKRKAPGSTPTKAPAALKNRQSLTKPKPVEGQPSNPKKSITIKYEEKPYEPKSAAAKKIMERMCRRKY